MTAGWPRWPLPGLEGFLVAIRTSCYRGPGLRDFVRDFPLPNVPNGSLPFLCCRLSGVSVGLVSH
jgi:hypothetical protein